MGISINTNVAASRASNYLASNHANLQKSLDRLSSGRRITQPADDAGGLAVSMKLTHTNKVLRSTTHNIANAVSLLQVQDGAMKSVADIVSRIGELKAMHSDVTKSSSDQANYDSEYTDLKAQITAITSTADSKGTSFNGINVFQGNTLSVDMDETGTTKFGIKVTNISKAAGGGDLKSIIDGANLNSITQAFITNALEEVASHRAANGGNVRRLNYQLANLETQITNLSAANGRIMDVDIAQESANLARQQVLVQASAAMTAQANTSNDVALMLLR